MERRERVVEESELFTDNGVYGDLLTESLHLLLRHNSSSNIRTVLVLSLHLSLFHHFAFFSSFFTIYMKTIYCTKVTDLYIFL